jgi:hypothetical protein
MGALTGRRTDTASASPRASCGSGRSGASSRRSPRRQGPLGTDRSRPPACEHREGLHRRRRPAAESLPRPNVQLSGGDLTGGGGRGPGVLLQRVWGRDPPPHRRGPEGLGVEGRSPWLLSRITLIRLGLSTASLLISPSSLARSSSTSWTYFTLSRRRRIAATALRRLWAPI